MTADASRCRSSTSAQHGGWCGQEEISSVVRLPSSELPPPAHPFSEFRSAFSGSERARSRPLRQKPERSCYLHCEESCNVTEADTLRASGLLACPKEVSSCE